MGGYRVQGRSIPEMESLLADALALEDAGAVALVLEGIPRELAEQITAAVQVPTIGIGAGPGCDGQILVFHDLFRLTFADPPKFVRSFGDAGAMLRDGIAQFRNAVEERRFPSDAESYHLPREAAAALEEMNLPVSLVS
jgi:3-methyl-2-oxobutanoate hydroxymethyltransferase